MATDKDGRLPAMEYLADSGFSQIKKINHPVDFTAVKDDELYYIELKYTTTPKKAFGNTPMTEWICAMENPENFLFLVVSKPGGIEVDSYWDFFFVTPKEMLEYSEGPILVEYKVRPDICLPLVSPGKSLSEMILNVEDIDNMSVDKKNVPS